MSTTLRSSPDCPVCNCNNAGTSTNTQRATHYREHLSIITTTPKHETVQIEKSEFSPDSHSSEYFRRLEREIDNRDPPTPDTIVGELPEELSNHEDPLEHYKYIKATNQPLQTTTQPLHQTTTVDRSPSFIQTVPYIVDRHHEPDLERNLPQTPHTAQTTRSSRSFVSRLFHPFWTTRRDEMPPQQFRELYPNEPFPPAHDELPRHTQPRVTQPQIKPWNPLNIRKKVRTVFIHDNQDTSRKNMKKRKKDRNRWCLIILIIIILFLLGDTIFLNVRVTQLNNVITASGLEPTNSSSSPKNGTDPNQLSIEAQTCLTQFQLNAPSSPTSYACSTCLPILQSVPGTFLSSAATSSATKQNITNAIQFCALKSVFDAAGGSGGSNPFGNAGWVKDTAFCTWAGVTCGGDGRVAQL